MQVTFYKRPDGRTEIIDCQHVRPDDEAFFKQHSVAISMEDLGGQFAVYADVGKTDEEGEPAELIELSGNRSCKDSLTALRQQCEAALV
jgi:hypothetical protein